MRTVLHVFARVCLFISIVLPMMAATNPAPPGKKWLTVAGVTMAAQTNTATNLQTFYRYMAQASTQGVDLIVFPEIALQQCPAWGFSSYVPTPGELAYVRDSAEPIPGPSTSNLVAKANELGIFVVFGMTESGEDGALYNASVFLGPRGILGKRRKFHLWGDPPGNGNEPRIFAHGPDVPSVIASPIGRAGFMICAEMAYMDGPVLANNGADFLVTCSAWPASFASMWDQYTVANAAQARRWHIVSNQTGNPGHVEDYGHSRVLDTNGVVRCDSGPGEGLVSWTTDRLIDDRPFENRLFVLAQPANQSVWLGSNSTFKVAAFTYDPTPPSYQWQRNATNLPGATNAELTLNKVQIADEGSYGVLITHPIASVLSDSATLTVLQRPIVIQPPLSQSVMERGSVTLSVEIAGNPPPFTYWWRCSNTPITKITLPERICFLTLTNVQTNQGGVPWYVGVTNVGVGGVGATFNLTVLSDANTNGLPDEWEGRYDITNVFDDNDNDGMTNWQEYVSGCNPTNAEDCLRLDSALTEASVLLRFTAKSNVTYTVQSCTGLVSDVWLRATDIVARATNRNVEIRHEFGPGDRTRFHRVVTPRVP